MDNQNKTETKKQGITKEEYLSLIIFLSPFFLYGLIEDFLWNEWLPKSISKPILAYFHSVMDFTLTTIFFLFTLGVIASLIGIFVLIIGTAIVKNR